MNFSLKSGEFWKKYDNYILFSILIAIVGIITYYRILIQIDIGPLSDSCDFLSNAYVFAGHQSYFDPSRPPFFSFLLSLIFRLGFVSTNSIFILDGLIFIMGVIGIFFLLKVRFNTIESFLGALFYATFPIVINVMSSGFSDLVSVTITIWTFYFLILAVYKNSRFFYLAFPLAIMAFLTRYNNALIIFPIFLYILINKEKIKNIKDMFIGLFFSLLLLIPVFVFFNQKYGQVSYSFSSSFNTTSASDLTGLTYYDPNLFFFIQKFPSFIGPEGILAILIIIIGLFAIFFLKYAKKHKNTHLRLNLKKQGMALRLILFGILVSLFIITFNSVHYIFSEVLFFILSYLTFNILKSSNIKYPDLHFLFFGWFMAFFIFHSLFNVKVSRYFVVMAPPIAYFLILGLSGISDRISIKIKNKDLKFPILTLILTAIILLSTAFIMPDINQSNQIYKAHNERMSTASQWFIEYEPDYKNKIIYSDSKAYSGWYLKTDVKTPSLNRNYNYNGSTYNNELEENNVDYYFCNNPELNLTSYRLINRFGDILIYKKESNA